MTLRLYMDHQVPFAITQQLRRRGIDVVTAEEDGSKRLRDPDILDRAGTLGRILVTEDDDFLAEATIRQRNGIDTLQRHLHLEERPEHRTTCRRLASGS